MDLITSRTIDITKLGMDGLISRQQAISSNIANVMTNDYKRKEVSFENQLADIIEKEDLKDYIKAQNSVEYIPPNVDTFTGEVHRYRVPTLQEKAYLKTSMTDEFNPQYATDTYSGTDDKGNNVDIERELMDMSKAGTRYTVLSTMERKQFSTLSSIIQGQ